MLISTALVLMMSPGLALFYGGMVRKKNVLGDVMQSSPSPAWSPCCGWSSAIAWPSPKVTAFIGGFKQAVPERPRARQRQSARQYSHLTLHALKDELASRGVRVSHNTVWVFLRREGLRFKKNAVRP